LPIQILNGDVGAKVNPKKGRLGTGAFWPAGVPIRGNVFAPNTDQNATNPPATSRPFGSLSNAGNGTQFGQSRVTTGAGLPHPNAGFRGISQQPHVPPFTMDGGTGFLQTPWLNKQPPGTVQNLLIQPHERNRLHSRKVFEGHFRTASGASRTLPSDTAFNRIPPKQAPVPGPGAGANPVKLAKQNKVGPSFASKSNLWQDPNHSFYAGQKNAITGETGVGRWETVKRGAAG
jgi:hypothetical protein